MAESVSESTRNSDAEGQQRTIAADRKARLAEELRANLLKRKAQARARKEPKNRDLTSPEAEGQGE
jgi:hypothetical protein